MAAGEPRIAPGHGGSSRDGRIRWRAVAGAALITVAAGSVLVATRAAQRPPSTRWLVLTEDVAAGRAITEDDLGSVALDLRGAVDAVPAGDAAEVVGRVAMHPLHGSGLLRPSDLAEPGRFATSEQTEVVVTLDPGRAPVDELAGGATVTVLATDAAGGGSATSTVAEGVDAVLLDPGGDEGIGAGSGVRIRLAAADAATAARIVDAAVLAELTVVVPAPSGAPA